MNVTNASGGAHGGAPSSNPAAYDSMNALEAMEGLLSIKESGSPPRRLSQPNGSIEASLNQVATSGMYGGSMGEANSHSLTSHVPRPTTVNVSHPTQHSQHAPVQHQMPPLSHSPVPNPLAVPPVTAPTTIPMDGVDQGTATNTSANGGVGHATAAPWRPQVPTPSAPTHTHAQVQAPSTHSHTQSQAQAQAPAPVPSAQAQQILNQLNLNQAAATVAAAAVSVPSILPLLAQASHINPSLQTLLHLNGLNSSGHLSGTSATTSSGATPANSSAIADAPQPSLSSTPTVRPSLPPVVGVTNPHPTQGVTPAGHKSQTQPVLSQQGHSHATMQSVPSTSSFHHNVSSNLSNNAASMSVAHGNNGNGTGNVSNSSGGVNYTNANTNANHPHQQHHAPSPIPASIHPHGRSSSSASPSLHQQHPHHHHHVVSSQPHQVHPSPVPMIHTPQQQQQQHHQVQQQPSMQLSTQTTPVSSMTNVLVNVPSSLQQPQLVSQTTAPTNTNHNMNINVNGHGRNVRARTVSNLSTGTSLDMNRSVNVNVNPSSQAQALVQPSTLANPTHLTPSSGSVPIQPKTMAPSTTHSTHSTSSTHTHTKATKPDLSHMVIRTEEIEAALKSKPQRGRKRDNLNGLERMELTRSRNREHAKCTRIRKKRRYEELVQHEKIYLEMKEEESTKTKQVDSSMQLLKIRSELMQKSMKDMKENTWKFSIGSIGEAEVEEAATSSRSSPATLSHANAMAAGGLTMQEDSHGNVGDRQCDVNMEGGTDVSTAKFDGAVLEAYKDIIEDESFLNGEESTTTKPSSEAVGTPRITGDNTSTAPPTPPTPPVIASTSTLSSTGLNATALSGLIELQSHDMDILNAVHAKVGNKPFSLRFETVGGRDGIAISNTQSGYMEFQLILAYTKETLESLQGRFSADSPVPAPGGASISNTNQSQDVVKQVEQEVLLSGFLKLSYGPSGKITAIKQVITSNDLTILGVLKTSKLGRTRPSISMGNGLGISNHDIFPSVVSLDQHHLSMTQGDVGASITTDVGK